LALAGALSVVMVGVIWWNLGTVQRDSFGTPLLTQPMPTELSALLQYIGLWQYWGMFSPYPSTIDGWIVIAGRFEDETLFDLRTGQRPAQTLPRAYFGPIARWKKFEENLNRDRYPALLQQWAAFYCRLYNYEVNMPYGHRLATLEIIWRYRDSFAPGGTFGPYREVVLWQQWCLPEYAPPGG
ncbi:MAG: hypothetical protein HXY40_17605, partial [Chloroflexi bacterium]|nr:hypothetical protein [Chloroflexota bacterium]